ncbi:hypothetical protein [Roseibium sp.]|uniref:hypothetical protein n=1 Tax=Roseibium sp. TaxID=1936156 RepID=UPI003B518010
MKDKTIKGQGSIRKAFENSNAAAEEHRIVLHVDYEKYMYFLEDETLSSEQKQEFIETIWSTLLDFVDLGFVIHPMPQVIDGLEANYIDENAEITEDKDHSDKEFHDEFDKSADDHNNRSAER